MNNFALEGWALLGVLIALLALGLLLGAALGYFTASTDLQRERAKSWDEGRWSIQNANPYRPQRLAPAPRHYVVPNPEPDPLRTMSDRYLVDAGVLFDQDAPTDAAKTIELRGDD